MESFIGARDGRAHATSIVVMEAPEMSFHIELQVPEQVYRYLESAARDKVTSVRSEARTCLIRGALIEWVQDELVTGASMSAVATTTGLPLEVVMEALGPVAGEGRVLGERA